MNSFTSSIPKLFNNFQIWHTELHSFQINLALIFLLPSALLSSGDEGEVNLRSHASPNANFRNRLISQFWDPRDFFLNCGALVITASLARVTITTVPNHTQETATFDCQYGPYRFISGSLFTALKKKVVTFDQKNGSVDPLSSPLVFSMQCELLNPTI